MKRFIAGVFITALLLVVPVKEAQATCFPVLVPRSEMVCADGSTIICYDLMDTCGGYYGTFCNGSC